MELNNVLVIVIKIFGVILLIIYFLIAVLIARQVFLMNKAIKTKLAGLLNCLSLLHILLIIFLIVFVVFLKV